jgi:hypothetical protein
MYAYLANEMPNLRYSDAENLSAPLLMIKHPS